VCCIQICTKLSEPIGTDLRIRYIKFGGNIKKYEYCYKFEIKYCGTIVLTDPFNYTVVVVHDLPRQHSVIRRARILAGFAVTTALLGRLLPSDGHKLVKKNGNLSPKVPQIVHFFDRTVF
jgi:hypothetical protein